VTEKAIATCQPVLERISAYLDGDLPAATCGEVERHCRECPECAALFEGLRRTVGLCREVGQAPLPASVRDRARERVRQLMADKSGLSGMA